MARKKARKQKPKTLKPSASKPKRQQFTPEQRVKILAAAKARKLTGKQVAKQYGISQVTYYLWRSKAGRRRVGTTGGRRGTSGDLGNQVRAEVQSKVRQILPAVVRAEVSSYLDSVFGSGRGRRVRG